MTTTIEAHSHMHEIQASIKRFADVQGLTIEQLAEKAGVPVSAMTGDRIFLGAIERVARTLGVTVDSVLGFGGRQPWCNAHEDDGIPTTAAEGSACTDPSACPLRSGTT